MNYAGEILGGALLIAFVTFFLTWQFMFKPRLEELQMRLAVERERRLKAEDNADAQVEGIVRIIPNLDDWEDISDLMNEGN